MGENKSKAAEEAAQDPSNPVSAADAEKSLTEQSKKAGAAAFQFDPDATPEQKAAQARAVRLKLLSTKVMNLRLNCFRTSLRDFIATSRKALA